MTMELRQRQPRIKNAKHLAFIRSLPCCICGGIDTEAAHIRSGSVEHGKPSTGMAEKPSDYWTVPLCNRHHREQHSMNELVWWQCQNVDAFDLALLLYKYSGDYEEAERVLGEIRRTK
jgi:hypothetical protein